MFMTHFCQFIRNPTSNAKDFAKILYFNMPSILWGLEEDFLNDWFKQIFKKDLRALFVKISPVSLISLGNDVGEAKSYIWSTQKSLIISAITPTGSIDFISSLILLLG